MKLIIDIPENEYRHIKEYYEKNDIVEATYSYIYHGIPLKQGHWIECEDEVKCFCSECKEISDYPTKFCPNCGAKMESEEQA